MICVMFLGTRMRAVQLSSGPASPFQAKADPDGFGLPENYVKWSMNIATWGTLVLLAINILAAIMRDDSTNEEGEKKSSSGSALRWLGVGTNIVIYGAMVSVVYGTVYMPIPKALWGNEEVPLSPAVFATISIGCQYFVCYFLLVIFGAMGSMRSGGETPKLSTMELSGYQQPVMSPPSPWQKYEDVMKVACSTMAIAPMMAVLYIACRMRALSMGLSGPQSWAQSCMIATAYDMLVVTIMTVLAPICFGAEARIGKAEGDVTFQMQNKTGAMVINAIRYICVGTIYVGAAAIVVSMAYIEGPGGYAPPMAPAVLSVVMLTFMYFL